MFAGSESLRLSVKPFNPCILSVSVKVKVSEDVPDMSP